MLPLAVVITHPAACTDGAKLYKPPPDLTPPHGTTTHKRHTTTGATKQIATVRPTTTGTATNTTTAPATTATPTTTPKNPT